MKSIPHIIRLLLIIQKIRVSKHVHTTALYDYVNQELENRDYKNISKRTLERDIESIRNPPFGMNIIHTQLNGYHLGEQLYDGLDIERILEPFDILNALNANTGMSEFIITEKHRNKGTEHLYPIIKAIKNGRQIEFTYGKHLSEEDSGRYLEPYVVKLFKGQWYVIGRESTTSEFKTFGLDRIKTLSIGTKKFKKDVAFDIKEKFKYSFGIYSSDQIPVEDIILSFNHEDGSYLKSVPLHPSQEIISETDMGLTIKLRLRITEDFVMAIIARSWSLRVIEPDWLRERIKNIYISAIERNSI